MAHSKSEIRKAKNLLSKYAPKGEQLAYINSKEANLLKRIGGAGKDINGTGIKSYFDPGSGRGSVSESLSESAGLGSSTSNNGGGGGGSNDNDDNNNAASAYFSPQQPQNILSKAGSGIVDYIKTGGTIGLVARTIGKVFNNICGRITQKKNKIGIDDARLSGSFFVPNSNKNYTLDRGIRDNNGGGNDTPPARNVGGKIIKLSPTTAEISQSSATDVTYNNRKTKARGRSMMIQTSSRGINKNNTLTLGKPSLLGA